MVKVTQRPHNIGKNYIIDDVLTIKQALEIINNIKPTDVKRVGIVYETVWNIPTLTEIITDDYRYTFQFTKNQQKKLEKKLIELNGNKPIKRYL